jgi:excisionase family DNA binding protein
MLSPSSPSSLLTTEEVCARMRICERTLARLRASGKISYVKLPGKFLYPTIAVEKFIAARTVQAL